jgi:hypothetical protein
VSRILTTLLITSLALFGFSEEYQIANKASAGYQVLTATMPYSLWTNSILWITAESPVLSAGTTNAEWVCYAKTCGGNAVQTIITSQPVLTNGAFVFDGSDDELYMAIPPLTNVTYIIYSQTSTNLASVSLGLGSGDATTNEHVANTKSTWNYYTWRRNSSADQVLIPLTNYPYSGAIECFVLRRNLQNFSITTRLGKSEQTNATQKWASAPYMRGIGKTSIGGVLSTNYLGRISKVIIFDRIITDEESAYFIGRTP